MEVGVELEFESPQATSGFASFKYKHDGAAVPSVARRRWFWLTLVPATIGAVAFFPGGVMLLIVPLLIRFTAPRRLELGMRYMICGPEIVYFGNVERVDIDADSGRLALTSVGGRRLVIEREKFPTSARKAHKIAANQKGKFDKVAGKVVERVRAAVPNAEIVHA